MLASCLLATKRLMHRSPLFPLPMALASSPLPIVATRSAAAAHDAGVAGQTARRSLNIVLLAHAYPPFAASGALRPAKVVDALRARGHRVHVITSRVDSDRDDWRVREDGLEVRAVRSLPNPRYLYVHAKTLAARLVPRSAGAVTVPEATVPLEERTLPAWKRRLFSMLFLPDDQQGFVLSATVRALPRMRSADLLYTTGPVISTHIAGLLLKRLTGVPWVAEFRDLWTQDPDREYTRHLQSRASVAIERWLEYRILTDSDRVVAVSEGIRSRLSERVDADRRDSFVLARNGIPVLARERRARAGGPLRALHLGSFVGKRDPRLFLQAVASLRAGGIITPRDLQIDFVGECETFQDVPMRPYLEALGLADMVRIQRWVPHAVARELTENADLLLLFAQYQPDAVPNKLYEYLGSRVPILGFVDDRGENAWLLRQAGDHHVITEHDEQAAVERAILRALEERARGARPYGNESVLREWTTERQMAALLDALGC